MWCFSILESVFKVFNAKFDTICIHKIQLMHFLAILESVFKVFNANFGSFCIHKIQLMHFLVVITFVIMFLEFSNKETITCNVSQY